MRRGRGGKGRGLRGGEAVFEDAGTWGGVALCRLRDACTAAAAQGGRLGEGSAVADSWRTCAPRYESIELTFHSITEPTVLYVHPKLYQKVTRGIHRRLAYEGTVCAASHWV